MARDHVKKEQRALSGVIPQSGSDLSGRGADVPSVKIVSIDKTGIDICLHREYGWLCSLIATGVWSYQASV